MLKVLTTAAAFALFMCAGSASAQSNENSGTKSEELNKAAQTVQEMTASTQITQQLLSQAKCIGLIPK